MEQVGFFKSIGNRNDMEDRIQIKEYQGISYLAVFDGHAGDECAEYAKNKLHELLFKELEESKVYRYTGDPSKSSSYSNSIQKVVRNAFIETHNNWIKEKTDKGMIHSDPGSTAVISLVDYQNESITCANVGDSLAILAFRDGSIEIVSQCHKCSPETNPEEYKRVKDLGGNIVKFVLRSRTAWYVEGDLNMTRSLGDTRLKKYVIQEPFVKTFQISKDMDFLLLVSDGILDSFDDPSKACEIVRTNLLITGSVQKAAIKLGEDVLKSVYYKNEVGDNISVVVVDLQPNRDFILKNFNGVKTQ